MADYLIEAKFVFDSLATGGFLVLDFDLVEYVVDGLGPKYQGFITSLHLRTSTTFNELFDLLIQEECLQQKHSGLCTQTCLLRLWPWLLPAPHHLYSTPLVVYLDDIVIYSNTLNEYIEHH